jgi:hypothetical protein
MGNDDIAGVSPNAISITEVSFVAMDYVDLVFVVQDFGLPPTEHIFTEGILNSTGDFWVGCKLKLGFGTGAGFVESTLGDGLDFDAPDYNSPLDLTPFAAVNSDEVTIATFSGTLADGASTVFTYAVDVPNGITEFTVRLRPRSLPVSTTSTTWGNVKALYR